MVKGRCMKCKDQVEMVKPSIVQTVRRGGFGYMAKGKCPSHPETTVCAIMSKDNAEKAIESGEAEKAF
ncbi:MAG: hypothetical protein Q8P81_04620 [Nanoarchaeota archaeon]|nr:hypothetical protein [Nanoarchaeota archaeon]